MNCDTVRITYIRLYLYYECAMWNELETEQINLYKSGRSEKLNINV